VLLVFLPLTLQHSSHDLCLCFVDAVTELATVSFRRRRHFAVSAPPPAAEIFGTSKVIFLKKKSMH
jgi:hypothetical protein